MAGHQAPACGKLVSHKFVDIDSMDPLYNVRNKISNKDTDDSFSEESFSEDILETPKRRKSPDNVMDSDGTIEVPRVKKKIHL